MEDSRLLEQLLNYHPKGRRRPGRPRKRLQDDTTAETETGHTGLNSWWNIMMMIGYCTFGYDAPVQLLFPRLSQETLNHSYLLTYIRPLSCSCNLFHYHIHSVERSTIVCSCHICVLLDVKELSWKLFSSKQKCVQSWIYCYRNLPPCCH
jgi:hypothetical protein